MINVQVLQRSGDQELRRRLGGAGAASTPQVLERGKGKGRTRKIRNTL
jgi:hypothetical protein